MLISLLLVALLGPVQGQAPSPTGQEPQFRAGDLDLLRARVVSADAIVARRDGTLLWIEVTNASSDWIEPVTFRLTPKRKGEPPILVARMGAPTYGRAGRLVAPRKKLRYPVVVPLEVDVVKKAKVEVLDASFVRGATGWDALPITVGDIGSERRFVEFMNEHVEHTTAQLSNGLELPVDLVFLAKFTGRWKGEGLVFASLEARETKSITWDLIPFVMAASPSTNGLSGIEFERLELVDWSVRAPGGEELASQLLARAWERRVHLADARLPLSADCRVTLHGHNRVDRAKCRLGFDVEGTLVVLEEGELTPGGLSELKKYLRGVACPVAQRSFAGTQAGAKLIRLGDPTIVHVAGEQNFTPYVSISNDAFVRFGSRADEGGLFELWTTREEDGAWLLETVETHANSVGNAWCLLRWDWRQVRGDWLPKRLVLENHGNHLWPERFELEFGDWTP